MGDAAGERTARRVGTQTYDAALPAGRPLAGAGLLLCGALFGVLPAALRLVALGRPEWGMQLLVGAALVAPVALIPRRRRWIGLVVLTAAVVVGNALAGAGMGRAPVVVAGLGVVGGVAAVDGWWSPDRWYRSGSTAFLALPLLVVAATGWFWWGSLPAAATLVVAALVVVHLCAARAAEMSRLGDSLAAVSTGVRRVASRVSARVAATVRRAPASMPVTSSRPDDSRRRVLIGVAVLLLAGLLVVAGRLADDSSEPTPGVDTPTDLGPPSLVRDVPFSDRPAFAGQPDLLTLEAEQRQLATSLVADPVTRTAVPDFVGRTTNVERGVRRSLRSGCVGCPRLSVWLVGGSAAFGLGQRDQFTIASELVRAAEQDGVDLEVVNLAAPGWTGWQAAAAVRSRLGESEPPDVVVVYDGFNDALGTVLGAAVGDSGRAGDRPVVAAEDVATLMGDWRSLSSAGPADSVGRQVADGHAVARASIRSDADRVGAEVLFVVQPDALAAEVQRAAAAQVVDERIFADFDYLDAVLESSATRMEADGSLNLRHSLDAEDTSVFGDLVHSSERGAAITAGRIYERLRPILQERIGRG